MLERKAAGQLQVAEATGTGSHNFPLEDWLVARGEKSRYIAVRTLRDTGKPLDAAAMAKMETFAHRKYQANALELVKAIVKDDPGDAFVNKDDETLETYVLRRAHRRVLPASPHREDAQLERGAAEHV